MLNSIFLFFCCSVLSFPCRFSPSCAVHHLMASLTISCLASGAAKSKSNKFIPVYFSDKQTFPLQAPRFCFVLFFFLLKVMYEAGKAARLWDTQQRLCWQWTKSFQTPAGGESTGEKVPGMEVVINKTEFPGTSRRANEGWCGIILELQIVVPRCLPALLFAALLSQSCKYLFTC